MKYLFVLNDYYPLKNASGACVEMVVKKLLEHNNDIHVLCALDENTDITCNRVFIHTVKTFNNQKALNRNLKSLKIGLLKRFFSYVRFLFNYPIQFPCDANNYTERARSLIRDYSIDIVVGVINPIETALILPKLKNEYPNLTIILYELDSIGDLDNRNSGIRKYFNWKRRKIEKTLYKCVDRFIYMKCHEKYFMSKRFDIYRHKMFVSDFPMYTPRKKTPYLNSFGAIIKLIFTGSLYTGVREPIEVVEILKKISNQYNICCSFFSKGNYEKYLEEEEIKTNGIIRKRGFVDTSIIDGEYEDSDILISIGNMMSNMVPSKIYSYMSYGKPILHFCFIDQDPCIDILRQYPYALILSISDGISVNSDKIKAYIEALKNSGSCNIPDNLFPLNRPEYTEKLFRYE